MVMTITANRRQRRHERGFKTVEIRPCMRATNFRASVSTDR
jgi:hypothetical protein